MTTLARSPPRRAARPPPRRRLDNGLGVEELSETITHLAFYAGWPNAMSAIIRLKKIADERDAA